MKEENHENDDMNIHEIDHEENQIKRNRPRYVNQIVLNFSEKEKNKRFDELISDLEIFKQFYRQNLEKIKLESERNYSSLYNTKLLIYNVLEKNMVEISSLSNKDVRINRINNLYNWYKEKMKINEDLRRINQKSRINRINNLYNWYKEKMKINEDLRRINQKSYKDVNEVIDEDLNDLENQKEQNDNNKLIGKDFEIDPHRNEEIIDKKIVNDYQRKVLSKNLEERFHKIQNNENDETNNEINIKDDGELAKTLLSLKNQEFSGGGTYSTFYSYKFGTNATSFGKFRQTDNDFPNFRETAKGGRQENSFFPSYNKATKTYYPPIVSETKFSYSYNRPEYNFENMTLENKIIKSKMKILAEKRAQEEIKSQIELMGKTRAKYIEQVNNKYEIRNVVDMYSKLNDFSSPLLQKYKLRESKSMSDIKDNNKNIFNKKPQIKNKDLNIGIRKMVRNNTNYKNNTVIENGDKIKLKLKEQKNLFESEQKMSNSSNKEVNKNIITKLKPKKNQKDTKIFSGILDKIKLDSIKNIENKKIMEPLKMNKVKIKLKINKEKIQNDMLNNIKKFAAKPNSEIITSLMNTDSLFQTNNNYGILCNLNKRKSSVDIINNNQNQDNTNESREEEEENYYTNNCLSLFDQGNLKKLNQNKNQNKIYPQSTNSLRRIKFNQMHKTFDLNKDNYLNLRRTLSDWKKTECLSLLNELTKNKTPKIEEEKFKKSNLRRQNSVLNAYVNPKDKFEFSQFYLPRTGSLLLKRKTEDNKKTKKKGKK